MKAITPFAIALSVGLAPAALAQETLPKPVDKGTPVVVIGQISSQPRDFGVAREQKMQVAVGPQRTDHTLHLRDAKMFDEAGREIAASDLLDKWWVRAEGQLMKDPRRIDVSRLTVLGREDEAYRRSAHFLPNMSFGYVIAENVAGERQILNSTRPFRKGERVIVVAPITSQPRDAGVTVEEKMQVAIGPSKTDFTLHFDDATLIGLDGNEAEASGLRDKMWVRAEGTVMDDARRIQVSRLQVIASDEPGFRGSSFFRTGGEHGYIISADD